MDYEKYKCDVCGRNFEPGDDIVVCPVCGTPQHRSCWQQTGHCVNEDKHADGFEWKAPDAPVQVRPTGRDSVCPYCGAINAPGSGRCSECGAHLSAGKQQDSGGMDPGFGSDRPAGPFSPVPVINEDNTGSRDSADNDMIGDIPASEYAAYVGSGAARYLSGFAYFSKSGKKVGFNWAPLIFAPIWFFYRKMKKIGLIIVAIQFLIMIIFGFASLDAPTRTYYGQVYNAVKQLATGEVNSNDLQRMLTEYADNYNDAESTQHNNYTVKMQYAEDFCLLAVNILSGLYADYIYMRSTRTAILSVRPMCTSMPQYIALLRSRGGTSPGMAVLGVIVAGLALYLASMIPILSVVV